MVLTKRTSLPAQIVGANAANEDLRRQELKGVLADTKTAAEAMAEGLQQQLAEWVSAEDLTDQRTTGRAESIPLLY